ncbi:hypothetical protein [Maribellus maritimus]|uniref:hypothetical protein n=1 Tax=Maribellus maritimus TaxID=2870838 RepID=UPI001EEB3C0B|nr:hypothetical protein [Maribellus maritimus]MCG6190519.1 hypothetical protein [Maribellus maritimus]
MLSNEQVVYIANKINEKVNLPVLGEKAEFFIIKKAVTKVLDILEDEIPEEYLDFLEDTAKGFDPEQGANIQLIKDNVVEFVNQKVNIPLLNEETEKEVFGVAIDVLIDAMTKDKKLEQ